MACRRPNSNFIDGESDGRDLEVEGRADKFGATTMAVVIRCALNNDKRKKGTFFT